MGWVGMKACFSCIFICYVKNKKYFAFSKQKKKRVNINISGMTELKWTGMGEFNSDDHYIYYCGHESLRRNGVAIIVNMSLKCSTWIQFQKWKNDLRSFPRQTYRAPPSMEFSRQEYWSGVPSPSLQSITRGSMIFSFLNWCNSYIF